MNNHDRLAACFEDQRPRLRAVAYRMLGSLIEADDAVQEAWLRLNRADPAQIDNPGAWLTTVVARICLDLLRARTARREESLTTRVPDSLVSSADGIDPEHEALLADSIGLALLIVLDTLAPAERLAFVLHDVFAVPFDEIAPIVGRTPDAARKLASRARRRVRSADTAPDADHTQQRAIVEAFLAASRSGDFAALLAVLDPDVVLRIDRGAVPGGSRQVRGAAAVVEQGFRFSGSGWSAQVALVNGTPGIVVSRGSTPFSIIGVTTRAGKIVAIDILADPARLKRLDLSALASPSPSSGQS